MLSTAGRVRIVSCLVEGCSVRATCRMTGFAKGTVLKLLADLGRVCEDFHAENVVNPQNKRWQCDEIWAFVGTKNRNLPAEKLADPRFGSVWTWTAIDADSTDHVWTLAELVELLERRERCPCGTVANKRGPYKTKIQAAQYRKHSQIPQRQQFTSETDLFL